MAKTKSVDMLSGNLTRNIFLFALPIMLMGIMQQLFVACDDMAILGIFVGDKALGAVGATSSLVSLFLHTFTGLSVGANVVVAQCIGAGDEKKTSKAVHTAITLSLILGAILIVLGLSLSGVMLKALETPSDIIEQSALYLRIYFFSTPATLVFSFGSAVLRAKGNSKSPFIYLTAAGITDIFLNTFFVLVFGMDVDGVALGTVISQFLSAILIVVKLMRETDACKLNIKKLGIDLTSLKGILKIGLPAGTNNMLFSLSNILIQSAINSFGSLAVAGSAASVQVENFAYAAVCSFSQAATSFTGQNYGAKKYDRIPKILGISLLLAVIIGNALGIILYISGRPLLSLFLEEPEALDFAMLRSKICYLPYAACAAMDLLPGVMRGIGKPIQPMIVALTGACVFRIVWLFTVFAAYPTPAVLYISFPVSWAITALAHGACLLRVYIKYKKKPRKEVSAAS